MRILMSVTTWEGVRMQSELGALGYPITVADDGIAIFECLDMLGHPVVLVETGIPDLRWDVAVDQLRKECPSMSVLVVDTHDRVADRMKALELGADDIIDPEMSGSEVAARILAIAARRAGYAGPVLNIGPLKVCLQERRVWWGAAQVHLSPAQYNIFETLCLSCPNLVSKDQIMGELYGIDPSAEPRVIDVFVASLRSRLAAAGAPRNLIETIHGRGYRLIDIRPVDTNLTAPVAFPVRDPQTPLDLRRAA